VSDLLYEGTEAAPTAGTAVVSSAALPAGQYAVICSVHLEGSGTPAAADLDNLALYSGTTEIGQVSVPEAKAVLFISPEIRVDVAASAVVSLQAVGNATASVTYAAVMRLRPVELNA
jgi:hypothetical protein